MLTLLNILASEVHYRWRTVRDANDGGYSTETVVVTALLIALAITVLGIIAVKVVHKANSINL
jgi:hypothetical protein